MKKSHSVLQKNANNKEVNCPPPRLEKLVIAKSLFMSPSRPQQKLQQQQAPITPLNKIRGLFSAYRERRDNSPMTASPASISGLNGERNASESLTNLSLLNVSATE